MTLTTLLRCGLIGAGSLGLYGAAAAASEEPRIPMIVELFTSQSCSSCPPAEELAERLVREQPVSGVEIIVLAEHVDYWDYLSWKDPYSSTDWTGRQHAYASLAGSGSVYTPQAVIDGQKGVVGSDASAIIHALREAAKQPHDRLQVSARRSSGNAVVMLDAGPPPADGFQYWAALVQDGIATRVRSGENGGATLKENGVIRGLRKMTARAVMLPLPTDSQDAPYRVVVFAQRAHDGRIVSAGQAKVPSP